MSHEIVSYRPRFLLDFAELELSKRAFLAEYARSRQKIELERAEAEVLDMFDCAWNAATAGTTGISGSFKCEDLRAIVNKFRQMDAELRRKRDETFRQHPCPTCGQVIVGSAEGPETWTMCHHMVQFLRRYLKPAKRWGQNDPLKSLSNLADVEIVVQTGPCFIDKVEAD